MVSNVQLRHERDFSEFVVRAHAPIATVLELMFDGCGHAMERRGGCTVVLPSNETPFQNFMRHLRSLQGGEVDAAYALYGWCVAASFIRALGPVDLSGIEEDFMPVDIVARQGAKAIRVTESAWSDYQTALLAWTGNLPIWRASEVEVPLCPLDPRARVVPPRSPWLGMLHRHAASLSLSNEGIMDCPTINDIVITPSGSEVELLGFTMEVPGDTSSWIDAFERESSGNNEARVKVGSTNYRAQKKISKLNETFYAFRALRLASSLQVSITDAS